VVAVQQAHYQVGLLVSKIILLRDIYNARKIIML
jgi:hypothetical protein